MHNGENIERVKSFKYLGVIFDPQLMWDDQISHIASKVSQRIGVIRRIKYYLPFHTLTMLANALVMPLFDYCSCVWSNCNVQNLNSLQILLNRLGRVLLSVDIMTPTNDIMNTLNWSKLNERWREQILIMIFKCLQGYAPSYLSSMLMFNDSVHPKCTRSQSSNTLIVPNWNNTHGKRTFQYRAAKQWNTLPNEIRKNATDMTLNVLKNAISNQTNINL